MDMMDEDKLQRINEIKAQILKEIPFVDIKPFSHNIISLELRLMSEEFGVQHANKIIVDYGLDKMGWCIEN
jgi:hypothetical protein